MMKCKENSHVLPDMQYQHIKNIYEHGKYLIYENYMHEYLYSFYILKIHL